MNTAVLRGVGEVAADYDSLLLDQFGVLHDGRTAYPAAVDAVRRLAEAGKSLVILSNSGRRAEDTLNKIAKLGFRREWFAGAMTSGETTHAALSERPTAFWRGLGRAVLHLTWGERGTISVDDLALRPVTDVEQADFVLAHGLEALSSADGAPAPVSLDDIQRLLRAAAARRLPLVIANPDIVTVDTTHLVPMPGQCGLWYAEYGGPPAVLMGKPAPVIYEAAMRQCRGRVLAVGDSLAHDIAGAAGANIDSLFVCATGIHAKDLPEPLTAHAVQQLAATHGCAAPKFAAQAFCW